MERWDRSAAGEVAALVDAALPAENLSRDDLVSCLWDSGEGTVVFGRAGVGVAAGAVRHAGGRRRCQLRLLAVAPRERGRGHGRALVGAVERWAYAEMGVGAVDVGGPDPYGLWPGVDVHAVDALRLFEDRGYATGETAATLSFPTAHRADPSGVGGGVQVSRAVDDDQVAAALAFAAGHVPAAVAEVSLALAQSTCLTVTVGSGEAVAGLAWHSVRRLGWMANVVVEPAQRRQGLGDALLGAVATDLMVAGLSSVEVAEPCPAGFYRAAAGAIVSRTFRVLSLGHRPA